MSISPVAVGLGALSESAPLNGLINLLGEYWNLL